MAANAMRDASRDSGGGALKSRHPRAPISLQRRRANTDADLCGLTHYFFSHDATNTHDEGSIDEGAG